MNGEPLTKKPIVANLYLDPMAEMFVFGCTIDYVTELGWKLSCCKKKKKKKKKKNATASCGAGESSV